MLYESTKDTASPDRIGWLLVTSCPGIGGSVRWVWTSTGERYEGLQSSGGDGCRPPRRHRLEVIGLRPITESLFTRFSTTIRSNSPGWLNFPRTPRSSNSLSSGSGHGSARRVL